LDPTKPYVDKIHSIAAELEGHAHKLDVKVQSLCASGFSLYAVHMLAKPYDLGVNTKKNFLRKQRWGTLLYPQFRMHNRYNKLLPCNSENGDIA